MSWHCQDQPCEDNKADNVGQSTVRGHGGKR
jgi:hypothetical protein